MWRLQRFRTLVFAFALAHGRSPLNNSKIQPLMLSAAFQILF